MADIREIRGAICEASHSADRAIRNLSAALNELEGAISMTGRTIEGTSNEDLARQGLAVWLDASGRLKDMVALVRMGKDKLTAYEAMI